MAKILSAKTKASICQIIFMIAFFSTFGIIGGLDHFSVSPLQAISYIIVGFIIMTISGLKGGVFSR